jgi:hypothetical protein
MRHAITRKTHAWDAESDRRLVEAVWKYGTENWSLGIRLHLLLRALLTSLGKLLGPFPRTHSLILVRTVGIGPSIRRFAEGTGARRKMLNYDWLSISMATRGWKWHPSSQGETMSNAATDGPRG